MANMLAVKRQLREVGFTNKHWGWSGIRQLPLILDRDERIDRIITGFYSGGHALVIATNKRIMIVDKKPMSFDAQEIHYEMVTEVEHYMGIFTAKLKIHCLTTDLELTSIQKANIQTFAIYVDQRVNKIRLNMKNVTAWSQMMDAGMQTPPDKRQKQAYPTPNSYFPPNNNYRS